MWRHDSCLTAMGGTERAIPQAKGEETASTGRKYSASARSGKVQEARENQREIQRGNLQRIAASRGSRPGRSGRAAARRTG